MVFIVHEEVTGRGHLGEDIWHEPIENDLEKFRSTWSSGMICNHLEASGLIWKHLGWCRVISDHLGSYVSISAHLGSSGIILDHLGSEVDKMNPRSPASMSFWHWPKKSTKLIPEVPIEWLSGIDRRSRHNQSHKSRFDDFLASAPEVDKITSGKPDLMKFWPWRQKTRK